jgi:signal transduction histidine kinase
MVERRSRGGLGLGLYICREIVRAHEGTIAVTSDEPTGTTFTVCLPRRPCTSAAAWMPAA